MRLIAFGNTLSSGTTPVGNGPAATTSATLDKIGSLPAIPLAPKPDTVRFGSIIIKLTLATTEAKWAQQAYELLISTRNKNPKQSEKIIEQFNLLKQQADEKNWTLMLHERDLSHTQLTGANLSNTYLLKANLSNANLSTANLTNANLGSASLALAQLIGANFSHANLNKANLYLVNLTDAILTKAQLHETNFTSALVTPQQVYSAFCHNTVYTPFRSAN
ncbi:MAG: pentapeptide repeat-containing protein [Vampirovibrionales bacterium]